MLGLASGLPPAKAIRLANVPPPCGAPLLMNLLGTRFRRSASQMCRRCSCSWTATSSPRTPSKCVRRSTHTHAHGHTHGSHGTCSRDSFVWRFGLVFASGARPRRWAAVLLAAGRRVSRRLHHALSGPRARTSQTPLAVGPIASRRTTNGHASELDHTCLCGLHQSPPTCWRRTATARYPTTVYTSRLLFDTGFFLLCLVLKS